MGFAVRYLIFCIRCVALGVSAYSIGRPWVREAPTTTLGAARHVSGSKCYDPDWAVDLPMSPEILSITHFAKYSVYPVTPLAFELDIRNLYRLTPGCVKSPISENREPTAPRTEIIHI